MKRIPLILLVIILFGGAWWLWTHHQIVMHFIDHTLDAEDVITIDARYTPDQIMNSHRDELLGKDKNLTYQGYALKYYPYLLLDVKIAEAYKKSREGIILWSLDNGEMVLNSSNWETTNGFKECLLADTSAEELTIINSLAKNKGRLTKDFLAEELQADPEFLDTFLTNLQNKSIVFVRGNEYCLHIQNVRLNVEPKTKVTQPLVTKPYSHITQTSKKFSRAQIEKIAKAAFGDVIQIQDIKEILLPVVSIDVRYPDGTVHTTYWNSFNGVRFSP